MKVKIGLVGLGRIGQRHLNAYSNIEDVELGGLYDSDNTALAVYSNQHDIPTFKTFEDLLQADVTAVDVCIPTYLHHEFILKALQEGKHVFCEKPLTHKREHALEISKVAQERGKMVMVGYLYRFHPCVELLKQILDKRIIGNPYYAVFRLGGRGAHKGWKHQVNTGGGAILDMLTHMLDLAIFHFGDPMETNLLFSDVILEERIIEGEKVQVDAEDCILAHLKSKTGMDIFLQADMITPSFMNTMEVHGDNGSFFGSIMPQFPTIVYCKEPRDIFDRGENVYHFPQTNLIEKELGYFVNCLLNSWNPNSSVDDSINILKVIEKMRG